jgi:TetR/AcrR family transcriptional regulator
MTATERWELLQCLSAGAGIGRLSCYRRQGAKERENMKKRSRNTSSALVPDPSRIAMILLAAKVVFVRDGPERFSARQVAAEAGMSLGNLQHFFPTKNDLVAGLIQHVSLSYEGLYLRPTAAPPVDPMKRLTSLIEQQLNATFDHETRRLFFGLYVLACHDKYAAMLVDRMYRRFRGDLAALIMTGYPKIPLTRCEEAAIQIIALTDGLMVVTGPADGKRIDQRALVSTVLQTALRIIKSAAG